MPAANGLAKRVLLVGWDGADWKMIEPLLEKGHMPNLQKLIERGVMGNVASLTPMLSPILWTSIATGKHADQHGILGFAEPDGTTGRIRPVSSTSRRCNAIWNILSERGKKAGVINWFASHPAEPINGFVVTDRFGPAVGPPDKEWPAPPNSVHPAELLEELAAFRIHPAATTPQQVAPFMPKLVELNLQEDKKLHELRVLLAHCSTIHSAATALTESEDWDFLGIYYDAIDRFAHAFMDFHPPKMARVSETDFDHYKDVMTSCYRFHDMMLGRLMQIAGGDTTIILVSDHGFHCDHLRPEGSAEIKEGRPVEWHRPYGVLVIAGPAIKQDQRVYGASLLDITPTVLWLLGLPVANDMPGKPLTQIAEGDVVAADTIDTYEGSDGAASSDAVGGMTESGDSDPWAAQETVRRLVELGYIEADASVEKVALDRARNLGQVYASTGRPTEAIAQYEQVLTTKPADKGSKLAIAECLLTLGKLDECEKIVTEVLSADGDAPFANLYFGMIRFRRGDVDAALRHLQAAEKASPRLPGLHIQIGTVYLRRERWKDAERAFKKALNIDPDSAEGYDGLGVALRWQKRAPDAVHAHMQSIALRHYRPQTHIHLGLALAETGQIDWAIRAFEVAIEQNPNNPYPHHCLAQLYERAKKDNGNAAVHQSRAAELRAAMGKSVANLEQNDQSAGGALLPVSGLKPTA